MKSITSDSACPRPLHTGQELQVSDYKVLIARQEVVQQLQDYVVHQLRVKYSSHQRQQQYDQRAKR